MLCVATVAMCFAGQDVNAQCGGGGGFGGGFNSFSRGGGFVGSPGFNRGGLNISYSSGYRGGFGGFNSYRPSYSPVYRSNSFYRGGGYGGGSFGRSSFGRSYGSYGRSPYYRR